MTDKIYRLSWRPRIFSMMAQRIYQPSCNYIAFIFPTAGHHSRRENRFSLKSKPKNTHWFLRLLGKIAACKIDLWMMHSQREAYGTQSDLENADNAHEMGEPATGIRSSDKHANKTTFVLELSLAPRGWSVASSCKGSFCQNQIWVRAGERWWTHGYLMEIMLSKYRCQIRDPIKDNHRTISARSCSMFTRLNRFKTIQTHYSKEQTKIPPS